MPPPPDQLLTTTRGVAFVIPGQDHNGHNGTTDVAVSSWNNWLHDNIGPGRIDPGGPKSYVDYALNQGIYSGQDNQTLLVITQDEQSVGYCSDAYGNHILLLLISAGLGPQNDSTTVGVGTGQAAQYNILKTFTKNFALGNLNNAGSGVSVLIPPL